MSKISHLFFAFEGRFIHSAWHTGCTDLCCKRATVMIKLTYKFSPWWIWIRHTACFFFFPPPDATALPEWNISYSISDHSSYIEEQEKKEKHGLHVALSGCVKYLLATRAHFSLSLDFVKHEIGVCRLWGQTPTPGASWEFTFHVKRCHPVTLLFASGSTDL